MLKQTDEPNSLTAFVPKVGCCTILKFFISKSNRAAYSKTSLFISFTASKKQSIFACSPFLGSAR